ncbi:MAG: hypothetical protein KBB13_06800 [Anaerolineaceae bacterium]|jgi:hypothetical protein|nr:hypothetical protein [Anaerolineaceae bacterium]HOG78050.1 hypothetical protein [Anaerolineaceae bacterium]
MIKKALIVLVLVFLTAACAPSAEAVQEAIRQTQAAAPTAIPTLAPTAIPTPLPSPTSAPTLPPAPITPPVDVSLPALLGHSEDLPTGYKLGSLGSIPDDRFTWITNRGTETHFLSIEEGDDGVEGYVAIFVYDNTLDPILSYMDDLDEVTRIIQEYSTTYEFEFDTIDEVGDKDLAYVMTADSNTDENIGVGFVRCNLYVRVSFMDNKDRAMVIGYAQKLDQRIVALGCQ